MWRGAPVAGGRRGAPPPEPAPGTPPLATFRDIASTFKDGLPLTPYAKELLAKHMARNSKDNPEASCLPMGIMQFWTQGFPRKFVQTPGLIVILYEASSGIRQIFTDGRPLPPKDDPQPWYYGYSSGQVGRRHARRRNQQPAGRRLARHHRHAADGSGQAHRAVPARELRTDGNRHHRRRSRRPTRSRGPSGMSRTSCWIRTSSSSSARRTTTSSPSSGWLRPAA